MSNIWFTSDLHFYHFNVIAYCNRPWKTIEEMNEELILRWNAKVGPYDTIYCLGDFSMAFRAVELFSHRLNGIKYLVPGNHDFCHSYHKRSRAVENKAKWISKYEEFGWIVLPEISYISSVPGIRLCHLPYSEDVNQDKYQKFRPEDDGKILLCGHVHEKWKVRYTKKRTLMINVGVDVWNWEPVSLAEIEELMGIGEFCRDCHSCLTPCGKEE